MSRGINEWVEEIHRLAKSKGWYEVEETDEQFISRACNNLHDEVSELHEAMRNGKLDGPCDKAEKMREHGLPALTCLEEELADVVIRALDDAGRLGVNIERAIGLKHEFNKTRPYRHGGKKC